MSNRVHNVMFYRHVAMPHAFSVTCMHPLCLECQQKQLNVTVLYNIASMFSGSHRSNRWAQARCLPDSVLTDARTVGVEVEEQGKEC